MGLGKFIKRATRKVEGIGKKAVKTAEKVGKKVAGYATQGQIGGKGEDKGASTTGTAQPQMTDEARRIAAGAGTVGYTGRAP